jgi:hypothetical protein
MSMVQDMMLLSSTGAATSMVILGRRLLLLERREPTRCAACGRPVERGERCPCTR